MTVVFVWLVLGKHTLSCSLDYSIYFLDTNIDPRPMVSSSDNRSDNSRSVLAPRHARLSYVHPRSHHGYLAREFPME